MIYANFAILLYCFHVFNFCVVNSFWKCLIDVINHCWGIGTYLVFSHKTHTFYVKLPLFIKKNYRDFRKKNYIRPLYKKLQPLKWAFKNNSIFGKNKRPLPKTGPNWEKSYWGQIWGQCWSLLSPIGQTGLELWLPHTLVLDIPTKNCLLRRQLTGCRQNRY